MIPSPNARNRTVDLTHDFGLALVFALDRIHMQTQVANAGGADTPPGCESHQYCRTEKRKSAYG